MRARWLLALCVLGYGCAQIAGIDAADTTPSKQHCVNGVRDKDEQDIDCGGKDCLACGGAPCTSGAQCQSNACSGGKCNPPTCSDGVFDGYESSVDCGDPRGTLVNCALCSTGDHCFNNCNCATGYCDPSSHTCADGTPACDYCADGVLDRGETGIDCGGPCDTIGKTCPPDGGTDGGGDGGTDGGTEDGGDGGTDGGDGGDGG
jgi:hypothetical protein